MLLMLYTCAICCFITCTRCENKIMMMVVVLVVMMMLMNVA